MEQIIAEYEIQKYQYVVKMDRFEQYVVYKDGGKVQENLSCFEIIRYMAHVAHRPSNN